MSKTIRIVTPDNVEIEYSLASTGVRAAAAGIDFLIHLAVMLVAGGISALVLYYNEASESTIYIVIAILILVFGFLTYGYFILCDMFMKGQTIGKRVYHIRIIRDNGEGIGLSHAMIREFLRATIDPIGVGFVMIFLNKKNKRLGDIAASTIVVEEEKRKLIFHSFEERSNSSYMLTKEESELLLDYFTGKDEMEEVAGVELRNRLVGYFKTRLGLETEEVYGDEFLKNLLN